MGGYRIDENNSKEKVEDPVNEPSKKSESKDVANVGTASGGIINNEIFLDVNTYKEIVDAEVDKKTKQMCLPDTEGKSLITYTSPGVFYEKDVDGNDTFSNAKAIKRFMDWEDKMLREMTEGQESEDDEKNNKLSIEDVTGVENRKESETTEGEKAIDQKELVRLHLSGSITGLTTVTYDFQIDCSPLRPSSAGAGAGIF